MQRGTRRWPRWGNHRRPAQTRAIPLQGSVFETTKRTWQTGRVPIARLAYSRRANCRWGRGSTEGLVSIANTTNGGCKTIRATEKWRPLGWIWGVGGVLDPPRRGVVQGGRGGGREEKIADGQRRKNAGTKKLTLAIHLHSYRLFKR